MSFHCSPSRMLSTPSKLGKCSDENPQASSLAEYYIPETRDFSTHHLKETDQVVQKIAFLSAIATLITIVCDNRQSAWG